MLKKNLDYLKINEDKIRLSGYKLIAGVDEAGRGPLAGPVVAAAVILNENYSINGINDSKKLSPKIREVLFTKIFNNVITVSFGIVNHEDIDRLNILNATLLAMQLAVNGLSPPPEYTLVDGNHFPKINFPGRSIIKGDQLYYSIAAASILAKVKRDMIMIEMDKVFPGYGLAKNKGYATQYHRDSLKKIGPSPVHRKSFLKNFYQLKIINSFDE